MCPHILASLQQRKLLSVWFKETVAPKTTCLPCASLTQAVF